MFGNDLAAIAGCLGAFASLGAIVKLFMDLGALKRNAETALLKSETAERELSDFKTAVAEKYASVQALAESEKRLADAMNGMRGDLRDLTQRIDRILSGVKERPL